MGITIYSTHPDTDQRRKRIEAADKYLRARTGKYAWRCARYDAALESMHRIGLSDDDTVFDVGAGMGEFGARLHTGAFQFGEDRYKGSESFPSSRARYVPVDAALDGADLEHWAPPRKAEWFVALELLEHLRNPSRLLIDMTIAATKGVIISTPNEDVVDTLALDPDHKTIIRRSMLELAGFDVFEGSFCGKERDSLLAVWTP